VGMMEEEWRGWGEGVRGMGGGEEVWFFFEGR
jgi:hypothetical protein